EEDRCTFLKVSAVGYPVAPDESIRLTGFQTFADLGRSPNVESPFFSFAVGIKGAVVESAVVGEVAHYPVEGFDGGLQKTSFLVVSKGADKYGNEQRLVV